jgi:hypothetical protein
MKIRTILSTSLLGITMGLGYTSVVQAHGDFPANRQHDRDYCKTHHVFHRGHDRHAHHNQHGLFLKQRFHHHEMHGHGNNYCSVDHDSRHGRFSEHDHDRHDRSSYGTDIRYNHSF